MTDAGHGWADIVDNQNHSLWWNAKHTFRFHVALLGYNFDLSMDWNWKPAAEVEREHSRFLIIQNMRIQILMWFLLWWSGDVHSSRIYAVQQEAFEFCLRNSVIANFTENIWRRSWNRIDISPLPPRRISSYKLAKCHNFSYISFGSIEISYTLFLVLWLFVCGIGRKVEIGKSNMSSRDVIVQKYIIFLLLGRRWNC